MAFKTDQIKLKEDYADNTAAGNPVDGTLALIGASGSRELKIRDDGSWVAISGGGGSLNELVEDLSPQLGGTLDANNNNINMGNNVITDAKVGQWDTAYSRTTITADQSDKVDLISVTQAVDLDDIGPKAIVAHSWGNHADANYGFSDVYQLSDLIDVDTPNTSSLGAQHEGKILGVVLGSAAVPSTFSIDLSGVDTANGVISDFGITVGGTFYQVSIQTANPNMASDVLFVSGQPDPGDFSAIINGTNDVDTIAADIRVVFAHANSNYWGDAYTISGAGSQAVITANVAGSASSILYNPNVSNPVSYTHLRAHET